MYEVIQATVPFVAVDDIPAIETGTCFYPSYRIILKVKRFLRSEWSH